MTKQFVLIAALTLTALPAVAQTPTKPLTPPEVLGAAKTIQFTATLYKNGNPFGLFMIGRNGKAVEISNAVLVQPNKACVVDTDAKTKAVDVMYVSNGKTQIEYRASRSRYTQSPSPSHISDIDSRTLALSTLTDFFDASAFAKFKDEGIVRLKMNDLNHLYTLPLGSEDGKKAYEDLWVDHKTGLPLHASIMVDAPRPEGSDVFYDTETERIVFSNWKLNTPIDDSKFAYTPPVTAHLYVAPQLLANGTQAPDFTVHDKDGKPVKLSDFKGKTVVLDFWATGCGPCQQSLPHTTKVAKEYADKNVVVLAVNVWDKAEAFQAWLPKHPEYAALNFAIDPNLNQDKSIATALYGVSGIPTQYVIDPSGKIIKSIVGYEEGSTDLEDALKGI